MNNLTIRPAGLTDAGPLAALIGAFRDHLGAAAPTDAELGQHLSRALADPAIEFSCAWLAGDAVGYTHMRFFTSIWVGGTEAHLDDLFVIAPARRQGVGRALLRHAVARAHMRGAQRFGLHTNEKNEAGQSLYRSEGLSPQSHTLYPGGREVFWVREI
jgi:GNAT superfamily N-acetyltransferase